MKNVTVALPSANLSKASINKVKYFQNKVHQTPKMDLAKVSKMVNRMVQAKRRSRSGVI